MGEGGGDELGPASEGYGWSQSILPQLRLDTSCSIPAPLPCSFLPLPLGSLSAPVFVDFSDQSLLCIPKIRSVGVWPCREYI